jgi:hypothetical protein
MGVRSAREFTCIKIEQDGDSLDLYRINWLSTAGRVPFSSGIRMATGRGDEICNVIFPLTGIKKIKSTNEKRGWLASFSGIVDSDALRSIVFQHDDESMFIVRSGNAPHRG